MLREIPALLSDIKLLMTTPGIGEITAIGIMSEVVDIAYFPST
ncbi:MAG: transposase [Promethearchaeota archaeon]